jgi:hypothetical protein
MSQLLSFFERGLPPWQTWVIPAAGLAASLLALCAGRFVLSRRRRSASAKAREQGAAGDNAHDPFEQGSVSEKRAAYRRKGNPTEVLVSDAEATLEPVRGWVLDRSVGGLCLLLHEEVAAGTVLSVRPRQAPPGTPWVCVEVRNCKQDRTGYEVRCEFVRTPPFSVQLLFG